MSQLPDITLASLPKSTVRVAAVQYVLQRIASFEEFSQKCEYFIEVASDYGCDFITFPELFTLQLLSMESQVLSAQKTLERLNSYTPRLQEFFADCAVRHQINIIAGSHPCRPVDEHTYNVSFVFLRDGSVHQQAKIQPTPNERRVWEITGGDTLRPIMTDCGPIGVLICYDSEFPELARHLVDQGVLMIFTPFCTDDRQGYLRVRYCSQARAVENQIYVVLSGCVGNIPGVNNMALHYGQSCILTPCDYGFSRDGIAAEAAVNTEALLMTDLNLEQLLHARHDGTVRNFYDRRSELYQTTWQKP